MLISIAAMTPNRLIGKNNTLPRYIPADLKKFKELTMGHTVIMWRKTYESLPESFRPLPWRHNIVISNQQNYTVYTNKENTSVELIHIVEEVLQRVKNNPTKKVFIIGWSQIYDLFLEYCDKLYITEVIGDYEGDTYFPEFTGQFKETSRESYDTHDFVTYDRTPTTNI
jgi:dihydrofolate reductase